MQYNYRSSFLVVINGHVFVCKNEEYKFEKPFFSFEPKHIFIGKAKVCERTEFSGAVNYDFDGKAVLLECENNEYVYSSGLKIFIFKTDDKIIDNISLIGNNMIPYAIIIGEK